MAQAKILTQTELKRLFVVTRNCSRYAERDLTMLQLIHCCGMRVGEVATLKIADVVDDDWRVRAEIVLAASVTKSKQDKYLFHVKCTDSFNGTLTRYHQQSYPTHTCLSHRSSHTSLQILQHSIYRGCMHRQR